MKRCHLKLFVIYFRNIYVCVKNKKITIHFLYQTCPIAQMSSFDAGRVEVLKSVTFLVLFLPYLVINYAAVEILRIVEPCWIPILH